MPNKINIMGVNVNTYNEDETAGLVEELIASEKQHFLVTPNPEIILKAMEDEEFFTILNLADLSIPDGIGLKFAGWCLGVNLKRVVGSDLSKKLLGIAAKKGYRIAVVNWSRGLSKKADIETYLKKEHPSLLYSVIDIDRESSPDFTGLNSFKPLIVFVGLGAPWQEKFMYHELKRIPSARIALGIGGTFDFLTGKTVRAPRIFRLLGLEWLWRLANQPAGQRIWRLKRISRAVFVFPYRFIRWRFIFPFIYRKNVACLLYRKNPLAKSGIEILLVERREDPGHWQIPQGGTDGLSLAEAGFKELKEELGNENFRPIGTAPKLYKYKFYDPGSTANYRGGIYLKHAGFKGQSQGLFVAEFTGEDSDIRINFWDHSAWKWVDISEAVSAVHKSRKESMKVFLEKFREIDKRLK